jgi:hypothetical protein
MHRDAIICRMPWRIFRAPHIASHITCRPHSPRGAMFYFLYLIATIFDITTTTSYELRGGPPSSQRRAQLAASSSPPTPTPTPQPPTTNATKAKAKAPFAFAPPAWAWAASAACSTSPAGVSLRGARRSPVLRLLPLRYEPIEGYVLHPGHRLD